MWQADVVGSCSQPSSLAAGPRRQCAERLHAPTGLPWRSHIHYLRRHGGLLWPAYLAWGYGKATIVRANMRMDGPMR